MKLFLIERAGSTDWDQYEKAVVCAVDEEAARNTHPSGEDSFSLITWCQKDQIKVTYLGEADPALHAGVVCASFHAG